MFLNPICRKCIDNLLKGKYRRDESVTVPCVSYRDENWHWNRMDENCPLMEDMLKKKIMGNITFEAEKEIRRMRKDL